VPALELHPPPLSSGRAACSGSTCWAQMKADALARGCSDPGRCCICFFGFVFWFFYCLCYCCCCCCCCCCCRCCLSTLADLVDNHGVSNSLRSARIVDLGPAGVDFLSSPSAVVCNLIPDPQTGTVVVPRSIAGGGRCYVTAVCVGGDDVSCFTAIVTAPQSAETHGPGPRAVNPAAQEPGSELTKPSKGSSAQQAQQAQQAQAALASPARQGSRGKTAKGAVEPPPAPSRSTSQPGAAQGRSLRPFYRDVFPHAQPRESELTVAEFAGLVAVPEWRAGDTLSESCVQFGLVSQVGF
jgi:hypothetical protein